ncbi:TPA: DUF1146 family protein [Streptococcus agalactiae]|nr:DUF1146 domain-containing protein [Streptococcus agalactiae]HEO5283298.1 DUF1146 domain-containing protein [Streptococcus agalactiae]
MILNIVTIVSNFIFIALFYQLFVDLFDWSKMIKMSPQNISKLKVFILLISIVGGYVVRHFLLEVIQLCQSIFWALQ